MHFREEKAMWGRKKNFKILNNDDNCFLGSIGFFPPGKYLDYLPRPLLSFHTGLNKVKDIFSAYNIYGRLFS
jgi:hypothetical protein